jgi:hypothetical protein
LSFPLFWFFFDFGIRSFFTLHRRLRRLKEVILYA